MAEYAAFLRGINVGGNRPVPMEKLRKAFTSLRFTNVRTVRASGNVLFTAPRTGAATLERRIEEKLAKTFGHDIDVFIRTVEELGQLNAAEPFKGISSTPQTRLYVTLLAEEPANESRVRPGSSAGTFRILRVAGREVCSVLTLAPGNRTVDLMQVLEKRFGKRITTRNWETIQRVLNAAGGKERGPASAGPR